MGGRHMAEAGVEIVYDIADLGVMGIVEVVKKSATTVPLARYAR